MGGYKGTNTSDDHDKVEFVVESELGRKRPTVSPSDLTIHKNHPDNPVIEKSLSSPEEENKNGIDSDDRVARYVTSSSSLTVDKIHANCLPPDYSVSKHTNIIFSLLFTIIKDKCFTIIVVI